jgi:Peptidase C39 family
MLALPDTRFPDQQWYDCGLVCAYCVLDYYGASRDYAKRLSPTATSGVSPRELSAVFNLAGLKVAQGAWDIRSLGGFRAPFIAYVNASDGIDHYVVVKGAGWSRVHYFDPDLGMKYASVTKFISMWHSVDAGKPVKQYGMLIQ